MWSHVAQSLFEILSEMLRPKVLKIFCNQDLNKMWRPCAFIVHFLAILLANLANFIHITKKHTKNRLSHFHLWVGLVLWKSLLHIVPFCEGPNEKPEGFAKQKQFAILAMRHASQLVMHHPSLIYNVPLIIAALLRRIQQSKLYDPLSLCPP